jgi:transcriptional regulator with XRE-family HTH domain
MKATPNQRLRQFRQALNLSPGELATALKLSISLIQKTESGHMDVSDKLSGTIQAVYKLPKAWLMEGKGEMTYEDPSSSNDPWKDEAWALAKEQIAKKDETLTSFAQSLNRLTEFISKLDVNFLTSVKETAA